MANYALPRQPGWGSAYRQVLPTLSTHARTFYELEPELGFEFWLQYLNPSYSMEQALRSQYDSLYGRYVAEAARRWPGEQYSWMDYLAGINPYREVARMSPEYRREPMNRFQRPVRWVSF